MIFSVTVFYPVNFSSIMKTRSKTIITTILLLLLLAVSFIRTEEVRSAIDLMYFIATPGDQVIKIGWGTATELDTSGFYVLRSLNQSSGYIRISQFIFSEGDTLVGGNYEYVDYEVTNGITYWYMLEEIDNNQGSTLYGPESAIPQSSILTSTPTPTITILSTPTFTPTSNLSATPMSRFDQASDTPSFPQTVAQETNDAYPNPLVSGDQQFDRNDLYPEPTEFVPDPYPISDITEYMFEDELIPFPSITVQFPQVSVEGTKTVAPLSVEESTVVNGREKNNTGNILLFFGIGSIWLIIAVWVIRLFRYR